MVNVKNCLSFLVGLGVLFVLFSCNKNGDQDVQLPNVKILQPLSGWSVQIPDSIRIRFEASDETQLKSATIFVRKSDQSYFSPALVIPLSGKTCRIDTLFPLQDLYMDSGNYTLVVSISDGANSRSDFSTGLIQSVPLLWKGYQILHKDRLQAYTTNLQLGSSLPLAYLPAGFGYSKRDNLVWISSAQTPEVSAYALDDHSFQWSWRDDQTNFKQYFYQTRQENRSFTFACRNNRIRTLDVEGSPSSTFTTGDLNYQPVWFKRFTDRMFVYLQSQGPVSSKLRILHPRYYGTLAEIPVAFTLVDLFQANEDQYWILVQEGSQGVVYRFTYTGTGLQEMARVSDRFLSAVMPEGGNKIYVGCSGGLRVFNTQTEQLSLLNAGSEVRYLQWERQQNVLLGASFTRIYRYDPLIGQLQTLISQTDSILDLQLEYNR